VAGFGADPQRRAAATAAYGEELGRALADDVDVQGLLDDDEPTRPHPVVPQASASQRASLEPVSDDAHPDERRRVPTHPELLSEALAAVAAGRPPAVEAPPNPSPTTPNPTPPVLGRVPEPTIVGPNRSPSPAPLRMGLVSADRITNTLACVAIGLALAIIPAQKYAQSHAREVLAQPMLELNDAIEHPLAVDAGLMRKPQTIAATIESGRKQVRARFLGFWMGSGLMLGLGLGVVRRWWV
jgi:hypothetical protein